MTTGTELAALQEQLAAVAALPCVLHLADDPAARCDTVGVPPCGACRARAAIADPDSALTKVRAAAVDAVRLELVRLNDIGNARIHEISTEDLAWFRTHPLLAEAETAVLSKAVPAFIAWLEELADGLRQGAGQ